MNDNVSVLAGGLRSSSSGGAVSSVNGKTGAVVLDADDVGAEPQKLTVAVTWDGSTYTADKTYAEIVAAYNAGKLIVVSYDEKIFAMAEYDGLTARFVHLGNTTVETLMIDSSEWTWAVCYLLQTPNIVRDLSSTSITLASAAANTEYQYGELTALTISSIPAGEFSIRFTSGATPTTTIFPATMVFPEAFAAEANTRYEINVSDGYALAVGWPVSS